MSELNAPRERIGELKQLRAVKLMNRAKITSPRESTRGSPQALTVHSVIELLTLEPAVVRSSLRGLG